MALTNLQAIRTKVRRLTRSPSNAQISDDDIDQYVNTFLLYDFPEHLRLFSLRTTLTFYTTPGVDVYQTSSITTDPLFNFKNIYIAIHQPVYIAGIPANFTQWRDVFFGQWPETNQITNTSLQGNGATGPFNGIVNTFPPFPSTVGPNSGAILQHSFVITCLDANNNAMVLVDRPSADSTVGDLVIPYPPQPPPPVIPSPSPYGKINYRTGQFSDVNFPTITRQSTTSMPNYIFAEYVPYVAGLPISMLYYDNQFTLRPVPDKTYAVQVEADIRPTELLVTGQIPQLEQWWQFIAYGCAKKIFEDRMDMDSVQMILPEYRNQMNFVNRTSLTQQANERTTTIYTNGKNYGSGWLNSNFPF